MTLDDIDADTTQSLTRLMDRLFKAAGCNPTCHCCDETIEVGDNFKLAMYRRQKYGGRYYTRDAEARDTMLCGDCSVGDLARADKNARRRISRYRKANPNAGYSRPSKVTDHDEQEQKL